MQLRVSSFLNYVEDRVSVDEVTVVSDGVSYKAKICSKYKASALIGKLYHHSSLNA